MSTRIQVPTRCICCQLVKPIWQVSGEPSTRYCSSCFEHRGLNLALRRATEHEEELRRHYLAAHEAATEYRRKMQAAYASRERAIRELTAVRDLHTSRGDGSCSRGLKRGCRVCRHPA